MSTRSPRIQMGFRWFGEENDPIPLGYIRQIPGVSHVVGAIWDIPVGEVWPEERIRELVEKPKAPGLEMKIVESVNIHDSIKIGSPDRDRHIANYIETIKNLSACGIEVICYNFMPVFDWVRTDLRYQLDDGSRAMAYERALVGDSLEEAMARMRQGSDGFLLPGWEEERLAELTALFESYADVSEDVLADNLRYFLSAVIPACEEYGVTMALHPDDPPHSVFGLPRIVSTHEDLRRIAAMVNSPRNGFTLCIGSLGENPENDVVAIIREFVSEGRVPFAHVRNIRFMENGDFHESAHLSTEGSLDMYEIMRALYESGFDGYVRPDHGRDIWGEVGRPGYGLYDRGLGISYLNGLWEALQKNNA